MRPATVAFMLVAFLALFWPALHNGFPILFHDSGAYLTRAFDSRLEPGRSPFYGFFIAASGGRISLWPVILTQSAVTLWLLSLTLRQQGITDPRAAALAAILLAAASTAAWGVATLMPDCFTPLAVLAWYLLVYADAEMKQLEKVGVASVLLLAELVHSTHLALVTGLMLVPGAFLLRQRGRRRGLAVAGLVTAIAMLLLPLVNGLVSGHFGFTPGGQTFIFGRLLQSGMVRLYLDEHCPSSEIRLCAYRATLPTTGDEWIWDSDSPFVELGGWDGYAGEMRSITLASLGEHPWLNLRQAAAASLWQFVKLGTGEDMDSEYWHTDQVIADYLPDALPALSNAVQHHAALGQLALRLNFIYLPVTFGAIAFGLAGLVAGCWRGSLPKLPLTVLLALLGNAILCGVFSGPHDRYQGRIAWLAVLAALVTLAEQRTELCATARRLYSRSFKQ